MRISLLLVLGFVSAALAQPLPPASQPVTGSMTQPTTRPGYTPPSKDLTSVGGLVITYQGKMVPAAVHVQAVDTTGKPLALKSLTYLWDFSAPGGVYGQTPGWTSGHLYKVPGTYKITLTVSDQTGVRTFPGSVTVAPDTRSQVTLTSLAGLVPKDNTHYFFKGNLSIPMGILVTGSNIVFDSTSGSLVYCVPADGSSAFALVSSCSDIVFQNLTFDAPGVSAPDGIRAAKFMGWMRGTNITVANCQFKTVLAGIESDIGCKGVLIQDNKQLNPKTIKQHLLWAEAAPVSPANPYGGQVVALGNIGTGSIDENVCRMADQGVAYGLFYKNDMSRPNDLKYPWTIRTADSVWFEANTSTGAAWGLEPRTADHAVTNCMFKGNTLNNSFYSVRIGIHDCVFTENTISFKGPAISVLLHNAQAPAMTNVGLRFEKNICHLQGRPMTAFYAGTPTSTQFVESGNTHD